MVSLPASLMPARMVLKPRSSVAAAARTTTARLLLARTALAARNGRTTLVPATRPLVLAAASCRDCAKSAMFAAVAG